MIAYVTNSTDLVMDERDITQLMSEREAREKEKEPYSEEEDANRRVPLFDSFQEINALASAVEDLEESLDVQDVELFRELSESMYE